MNKLSKAMVSSSLALMLAGGMTLLGATAANAAGTCSNVSVSSGSVSLTCKGTVKYVWKCSSDLFGTVNTKYFTFPSTYYSTQTFRACNIGNPVNAYWASV